MVGCSPGVEAKELVWIALLASHTLSGISHSEMEENLL